eukprot:scaffold113040_cov39-Attheya_sp.AAC.1
MRPDNVVMRPCPQSTELTVYPTRQQQESHISTTQVQPLPRLPQLPPTAFVLLAFDVGKRHDRMIDELTNLILLYAKHSTFDTLLLNT